jgi:uncharacterized C2H2 Zn-finger protein
MEYIQIIRGGGWSYGTITCENGMVLEKKAGNNERLHDGHMICDWASDPVSAGLPRCETCDAWFINQSMFQGHLNKTHTQGLREMKAKRTEVNNALHAMRNEHEVTSGKIDALYEEVMRLDNAISEKEAALAAAQHTNDDAPQPLPDTGRVSLGGSS